MWNHTLKALKKRLDKIEHVTTPQWLESLSTEELYKFVGLTPGDDMALQERSGVPPSKRQPFEALTTEQLIRIANGEDLVKVFDEDNNTQLNEDEEEEGRRWQKN